MLILVLKDSLRTKFKSLFLSCLSALVLSPLRAQQFGIHCLTVHVIQLLGLISFDMT